MYCQDCLKYGPATYNLPNNGPANVVICIDIIEKYPQDELDWVVLHECGHIHYRHPGHQYGRTKKENELCADLWACKQQKRIKYGIDALMRLCNSDISRTSHTTDDDLSQLYAPRRGLCLQRFTFGVRINTLKNSGLPY